MKRLRSIFIVSVALLGLLALMVPVGLHAFASSPGWVSTGSMQAARFMPTATLLPNGQVLVAGGRPLPGALASAELYTPSTGTWSSTGSMFFAHSDHTATLLPNGKVLVVGGGGRAPEPSSMTRRREPGLPLAHWSTLVVVTRRRCCPTARCWWLGGKTAPPQ